MKNVLKALTFIIFLTFVAKSPVFASTYINANFEGSDFVLGGFVPVGNNDPDRPNQVLLSYPNIATIEDHTTIANPSLNTGKFMRIVDVSDWQQHTVWFDLYDTAYDSGVIKVSWDILFESFDRYDFGFKNGLGSGIAPAAQTIGYINAEEDGRLIFVSGYYNLFFTSKYEINKKYHYESLIDLDNDTWSFSIDGENLFIDEYFPDTPFGGFFLGNDADPDLAGAIQVDNLTLRAVPIPSALFLLMGGMSVLGILRKKYKL